MKMLDEYFKLQEQIYKYFGYVEDWRVIPLDDGTMYFWCLGDHDVKFAEDKDNVFEGTRTDGYVSMIYTQRFLPKHIYRTEDYTMICVDTETDGNKFLQVFDNSKEIKEE